MRKRIAQATRAGQAEFVRWFGPLLDALRDLGGSASPREAVDRIAETERVPDDWLNATLKSGQSRFYELGLKPRVVYDVDPSFFEQFA